MKPSLNSVIEPVTHIKENDETIKPAEQKEDKAMREQQQKIIYFNTILKYELESFRDSYLDAYISKITNNNHFIYEIHNTVIKELETGLKLLNEDMKEIKKIDIKKFNDIIFDDMIQDRYDLERRLHRKEDINYLKSECRNILSFLQNKEVIDKIHKKQMTK